MKKENHEDQIDLGANLTKEQITEIVKELSEAAKSYEARRQLVYDFMNDYNRDKIEIDKPKKKQKAAELALLKFHATASIFNNHHNLGEESTKTFVEELFRQIAILRLADLIRRKDNTNEKLEREVQQLRIEVDGLKKENGSEEKLESVKSNLAGLTERVDELEKITVVNERLTLKTALEMILMRKDVTRIASFIRHPTIGKRKRDLR